VADEKKTDQEQQELDEMTVLQDGERQDLSAEEQAEVQHVDGEGLEASDLAGTVLAGTPQGDIPQTEPVIPESDQQTNAAPPPTGGAIFAAEATDQPTETGQFTENEAVQEPDRRVGPDTTQAASPGRTYAPGAQEEGESPSAEAASTETIAQSDTTVTPQAPLTPPLQEPGITPAPETVETVTPEPEPDVTTIPEPEPDVTTIPEPEPDVTTIPEPEPDDALSPDENNAAPSEKGAENKPGNRWGQVEEGPDQGKAGQQESEDMGAAGDSVGKGGSKGDMGLGNGLDEAPPGVTEDQPHYDDRVTDSGDGAEKQAEETVTGAGAEDDDSDPIGKPGNRWGQVEEGPDQGKAGQQESEDMGAAGDSVGKGGSKGDMGLGNGLDEAPPGVTEDQPHYDDRVIDSGDTGDVDVLETDFFLMDSEDAAAGQGGWTNVIESEKPPAGDMEMADNGWTDQVEEDPQGPGKGKADGKQNDFEDKSPQGNDTMDVFDQDAEDFPDQSDW